VRVSNRTPHLGSGRSADHGFGPGATVKPSDAHVIWCSGRDNDGRKRFDFEYLELWAAHFGVEYEQWERVDHQRGDEPREQHVCVFARAQNGGEEVSLGGETWTMAASDKPRTFIEIDEAGMLRLRGWSTETTLDVEELVVDGTTLKLRTAAGETRSLDTSKLTTRPERV
jgi:hypothetical protein